jgi:opacity protein-like surface antigen
MIKEFIKYFVHRERKKIEQSSEIIYLIITFFLVLLISFPSPVLSQTTRKTAAVKKVNDKKVTDAGVVTKEKEEKGDKTAFKDKYSPGFGFIGGIINPSGDVSASLGMGYGGQVYYDFKLPIRLTRSLQYRLRFNGGYYTLPGSGEFGGTLTMMPLLATFEFSYPGMSGFRPYFGIGFGATYVTVSGDSGQDKIPDGTSTDATLSFSIGIGYTSRSVPNIEYILDFNYIMAFETVIGQFSTVSAGVAYRFKSPWSWMKEETGKTKVVDDDKPGKSESKKKK